MRSILLTVAITLLGVVASAQNRVERVEPPCWWTDMNSQELQVMVYGDNLADLTPSISYDGVSVERVISVENRNYIFIDLTIDPETEPGTFLIEMKRGKKVVGSYSYQLLQRDENSASREGFNNSDVMYLITPDRFVNGDPSNDAVESLKEGYDRELKGGRHGGDIAGIESSLDYLKDMGFTAIWVNPLLENDQPTYSYHGYSTTDYYKVDERFGSNKEYQALGANAKKMGIKLIMDMIVNHCGSEHWWMKDLPTSDWINNGGEFIQTTHIRETNMDPYAAAADKRLNGDGWFVESMPDLNQRNPLMAKYLIQNSIWWIEYAHLAGIRQDTWPYPDKEFMNDWCNAILAEYPDFNIVGEEWSENPAIVSYWQKGQVNRDGYSCNLPSLMDFPLQKAIAKGVSNDNGFKEIYGVLSTDFLYPDPDNLVTFLDNHDMSRIFTQVDEDLDALKQGLAYLLTVRGIPQIYYGTEVLMSNEGTDDHGVIRTDFPGGWSGDKVNAFTEEGLTDDQIEIKRYIKQLLNWRSSSVAVHEGKTMHFAPIYDQKQYTLFRYTEDKIVMLTLNGDKNDINLDLSRFKEIIGKPFSAKDVILNRGVNLSEGTVNVAAKGLLLLEITR